MLRPAGPFASVDAANNQLGHGLYQFSPELFWHAFAPDTGFAIEKMQLVPLSGMPAPIDLQDTAGVRQQVGRTDHAMYLMVAARRQGPASADGDEVYQSDYQRVWRHHQA